MKTPQILRDRRVALRDDIVGSCDRKCDDGYLRLDNGLTVPCGCLIVARYLTELLISGITRDYWQLSLDTLEVEDDYKSEIRRYLKNLHNGVERGMGFIFCGANGVGKTSLMSEIAKEAVVHHYEVRYFTLAQYISAITENDRDRIAYLESGDVILLDELDKQYVKRGSDFVVKTLDECLRRLMAQQKAIHLGSNWSEEDVRGQIGESLPSLIERRCKVIELMGEDFSTVLSSTFWDRLEGQYDYYHPSILEMAKRRYLNGIDESD